MFGLKRGGAHNIISLTPMWGLLYTLHRRRYFNPEIKPFPKFLWAKGISHSCVLVWLCLVQALIIADSYERVYGGSIRCNHNWYTLPLPPDIWRPLPNIQHPELCLAELIYAKTYWMDSDKRWTPASIFLLSINSRSFIIICRINAIYILLNQIQLIGFWNQEALFVAVIAMGMLRLMARSLFSTSLKSIVSCFVSLCFSLLWISR